MIFTLWDAAAAGNQVGPTLAFDGVGGNPASVGVSAGLFTVGLDFGTAFAGNDRWLNIQVRYPAGGGAYTALTPRQKLAAIPYALYALSSPGSDLWTSNGSATYNTAGTYVGINRTSPITGADYFSVRAPVGSRQFGGTYIDAADSAGWPSCGYATSARFQAYHYYDGGTGNWQLAPG